MAITRVQKCQFTSYKYGVIFIWLEHKPWLFSKIISYQQPRLHGLLTTASFAMPGTGLALASGGLIHSINNFLNEYKFNSAARDFDDNNADGVKVLIEAIMKLLPIRRESKTHRHLLK